jgi:hypothetical protein
MGLNLVIYAYSEEDGSVHGITLINGEIYDISAVLTESNGVFSLYIEDFDFTVRFTVDGGNINVFEDDLAALLNIGAQIIEFILNE